ncbi:alpha/beta-hydrolase [Lentinus tigrinus ALCF2SS1-7]|uniref:alpha/beta-hydrolase n=1 Tax=Lentinus tigrinus ALCF2SS1-7 TaxID=1328758 RepID=UPI0011660FBF|nr:alpha/beta-hydrolase [Lentinus tigrinus ALCF2SS1-7]
MTNVQFKTAYKFLDTPHGTKLYTERWSAGTDTPSQTIILVHGMGSNASVFFPFIKSLLSLIPTAHVIAYDWPGSGQSLLPALSALEVPSFISDLDALIAAEASTGPISIVAHSAGTVVASRYVLTASPHVVRVSHIVYLGGPINPPFPAEVTAMQEQMAALIVSRGPSVVVDNVLPMLVGKTTMAERPVAVGFVRAITLSQSAAGYAGTIMAFRRDVGEGGKAIDWAAIQKKAKVLAVYGDEDVMVLGANIAGFLDQSPVKVFERVGHTLTVEAPEETAKVVAEFMAAK